MVFPRIIVSALSGGSGKTILSLGLIASWRKRGIAVVPFKKGPDYIDAGWLAFAASSPCRNLDTFFMPHEVVLRSFTDHASPAGASIIEGNRGLYDGMDVEGNTSTSELAKLLRSPVVLTIDCTKSTRTVAALVMGCRHFDPNVMIKGVILNRIAGSRHESILRKSIEYYTDVKVLGAIPKLKRVIFPERHMGLIPTQESPEAHHSIQTVTEIAEQYLDIEALLDIAHKVPSLACNDKSPGAEYLGRTETGKAGLRIGIIRDAAFQFYYPENLDALTARGAELVPISPLSDRQVPGVDGLYIGGGFPETHAELLASNQSFRKNLRQLAENGLPIYAECGGLMYLGKELLMDGRCYPMVGVLPIVFGFSKRPQAHGYTVIEVDRQNPYFEVGTKLRGHEFHYSKVLEWHGQSQDLAFKVERGTGLADKRDGVCYKNVLATYTHIHALGFPCWADGIVRRAWENKQKGIFC